MRIRKIKKYFGLCQCKGCLSFHDTIVSTSYGRRMTFYPAYVCSEHAISLIRFPYTEA